MKKIIAASMVLVMAASMTACGSVDSSSGSKPGASINTGTTSETITEAVTTMATTENFRKIAGGWNAVSGDTSLSANKNAKAAFEKATGALAGMEYEPLAVIGTQVVAGTNYCILCRGKATVPDAKTCIVLVYIYEDLQGNAEITGSKTIIGDEILDGGWSANSGDTDIAKNADVKKAFEKSTETLTGAVLEPVAYLGSQVVAGSNYRLLCKSTATVPGAETEYALVTVYADLNGNAEISDISEITFGKYDDDNADNETSTGKLNTQITNSWAGCEVDADAAKADIAEIVTGNH